MVRDKQEYSGMFPKVNEIYPAKGQNSNQTHI